MHLKNTSETFLLIFGRIQNIRSGIRYAGIYTEECEFSYERIGHDLECESRERLFVGRMSLDFISVKVSALDRRDVKG